jgi:hypothetical protein
MVGESIAEHKYSRLANSSYDYVKSKGKIDAVHEGLQNSKYNYIDDFKDCKVSEEMSTIDHLVLGNAKTCEANVRFRGATTTMMLNRTALTRRSICLN